MARLTQRLHEVMERAIRAEANKSLVETELDKRKVESDELESVYKEARREKDSAIHMLEMSQQEVADLKRQVDAFATAKEKIEKDAMSVGSLRGEANLLNEQIGILRTRLEEEQLDRSVLTLRSFVMVYLRLEPSINGLQVS
eukprot:m.57516 g.57516  ORF g.57516 m.57516 type:complete len:142 (+) comp34753_c0_seq2:210-635(+)